MILARNSAFVIVALLIDGMQAAISWGIAAIAAFPGPAIGCAAGNAVLGQIGCWVGGGVIGLLSLTPAGLAANALVATVTVPLGIALGITINICISFVGGAFLLILMKFFGVSFSLKRLVWGGGELIPGINNIPFWTFFTISTLWTQATNTAQEKSVLALAGRVLPSTQGMMSMRERTMTLPGVQNSLSFFGREQEKISQPTSARELTDTSERRVPLQDVRPAKPNVQTA